MIINEFGLLLFSFKLPLKILCMRISNMGPLKRINSYEEQNMKCPVCSTIDLLMTDRQGVEIDYCPQCRGVWLDRGELDKIIERSTPAAIQQPPPMPEHRFSRKL